MSRLRKNSENESVQSVNRAFALLEIVAKENNITISKLAEKSGLKVSTTHRLVSTMMFRGFIDQDPMTLQYSLGLKAFELANAAFAANDLRPIVHPLLEQLRDKINETVNLAVLDGVEVVYIDQMESMNAVIVRMFAKTGSRGHAYCTGAGKILLAELSTEELKARFNEVEFIQFTDHTITSFEQLTQVLKKINAEGYALDFSERDNGVTCVAAPIRNYSGQVQAAISISAPENRMTMERIQTEILPSLLETTLLASQKLGFIRK